MPNPPIGATTGAWRVVVQLQTPASKECRRFSVDAIPHQARIEVVACDASAVVAATEVYDRIVYRVSRLAGATDQICGGPQGLECMAWRSSGCQQVLILVVGSAPLAARFEQLALSWKLRSNEKALLIPALLPGVSYSKALPQSQFPTLRSYTAATWNGSTTRLADSALTAALLEDRPGVFLSYVRADASAAADALHDALTRSGYRVFLDRFQGNAGRLFPHELAEEMCSMGLLVLLETASLYDSDWTMWEAGLAERYRIGPVAINFQKAPRFPNARRRLSVNADPAQPLKQAARISVARFIEHQFLRTAIERRGYYETKVFDAARRRGGTARALPSGLLELRKQGGAVAGTVLCCGCPARLHHVKQLATGGRGTARILAGEHQHLPPAAREDLAWLASSNGIALTGSSSVVADVERVL